MTAIFTRQFEKVRAAQWTGDNGDEIMDLIDHSSSDPPPAYVDTSGETPLLVIGDPPGYLPGGWVVVDEVGDIEVMLPATFERRFTPGVRLSDDPQLEALRAIEIERLRQDEKWGNTRDLPNDQWFAILMEEIGEVGTELIEPPADPEAVDRLRTELQQSAAVIVAWLENIARKEREGRPQ